MEDKMVYKFITKIKDKLSKNKAAYPSVDEYAFSTEEIKTISVQNRQKIQELKQDVFAKKKEEEKVVSEETVSSVLESVIEEREELLGDIQKEVIEEKVSDGDDTIEDKEEQALIEEEFPKNSFVNLNEEYQKIVMNKWKEIELNQIDKDIIDGKDLLNHNYTITYADDAAKFIHGIRKKYEVVICYLIGFNNEKKGIYEKTIFSSKMDDEWKYLANYIKVLEKIRGFRK